MSIGQCFEFVFLHAHTIAPLNALHTIKWSARHVTNCSLVAAHAVVAAVTFVVVATDAIEITVSSNAACITHSIASVCVEYQMSLQVDRKDFQQHRLHFEFFQLKSESFHKGKMDTKQKIQSLIEHRRKKQTKQQKDSEQLNKIAEARNIFLKSQNITPDTYNEHDVYMTMIQVC